MKKKCTVLLLLTLLMFCLTGCSTTSIVDKCKAAWSTMTDKVSSTALDNKLSKGNWSSATNAKGVEYMSAVAQNEKVMNKTVDDYNFNLWGLFTGKGVTRRQQLNYERRQSQAKVASTKSSLKDSMSKDEETMERYNAKQNKKNTKSWIWILLAIVAVVIIVLLFRKKNPAEDEPVPTADVERKDLRSIKMRDWDADGRKLCKKKGLVWEDELAKNHNDKVKTVKQLMNS